MTPYSRRNANAATNLRAAGIKRDTKVNAYTQWRRLTTDQRAAGIVARAQAQPSYRAGGSAAQLTAGGKRGQPRRVVELADRRIVQTGSAAVVLREIRGAADDGTNVTIRAAFQTPQGDWRTRVIDSPAHVDGAAEKGPGGSVAAGQRPGRIDSHVKGTPRGPALVELQTGAGAGIPAAALVELIDDWEVDDAAALWELIAALWEAVYG